ncbi:hypothetical protein Tco_0853270 [Tanacetum coccineum]
MQVTTQGFTFRFSINHKHTLTHLWIREDSSLDKILDDLFKIGVENLKKIEHEILNKCDDITDYVASDQEDGELPDLPTFPATYEFASDSEQVKKNIDIAEEKTGRRHFKSELGRYHAEDDDGIFVIMDVARRSRLRAWLRACYLFIIPSKSRGVFRFNSTLIFNLHFLNLSLVNFGYRSGYITLIIRMPNVMLAYHDQWDKISVAMTCSTGILRDSMTLEEYARYELAMSTMKNEIQVPTQGFTSQSFNQLQYTPKLPLDEEESNFDEILDDLFIIGAKNIRKMEHEIPNRCDDINVYEDCDHKNGELLNLPTFSATNEIASDREHVEENIDIPEEKEEVPMKDVEMDENPDIDHSGTEEEL